MRPLMRIRFHRGVVGVELGGEEEEAGDTADGVGEVGDFVHGEGAAEEGRFPVGEPFFQHLVAAERVFPDPPGDVLPVGGGVEVDIERIRPQQGDAALSQRGPFLGGEFAGAGVPGIKDVPFVTKSPKTT